MGFFSRILGKKKAVELKDLPETATPKDDSAEERLSVQAEEGSVQEKEIPIQLEEIPTQLEEIPTQLEEISVQTEKSLVQAEESLVQAEESLVQAEESLVEQGPTAESRVIDPEVAVGNLAESVIEEEVHAEPLESPARQMPHSEPSADEAVNKDEFILSLRAAQPSPGGWLKVVFQDIEQIDAVFWQRLGWLFSSLEIETKKSEEFIADLKSWLEQMGYSKPDDFSSELQYRLAIALGMENEVEEKKRFLAKLWAGLARTREFISGGLRDLFSGTGELDNNFWDSLEEVLIVSDVGYEASLALVERVRLATRKTGAKTRAEAKAFLQAELEQVLTFPLRVQAANLPEIVLMVGVNGAGKTTTIAKLAYREHLAGKKVLIVAGDTFRAAAVEQLEVWAKRVGAGFYAKQTGSTNPADPAAVAYEAVGKALSENYDVVFIDTAGRLQTKTGLMEELGKIVRVLSKRHPGAPHRTILVLDATTGQNALSQAKLFSETSPVSEIIISKLDGTAKAGVAVGIAMQQKIPISFIGLGEKMEDLRPFDGPAFAKALLD